MPLGLVHDHHDIIGRLVEDKELSVAVCDNTARGEVNLLEEGVGIGTLLVVVAGNLEHEEAHDIDDHNQCGNPANDKPAILKPEFLHALSANTLYRHQYQHSQGGGADNIV